MNFSFSLFDIQTYRENRKNRYSSCSWIDLVENGKHLASFQMIPEKKGFLSIKALQPAGGYDASGLVESHRWDVDQYRSFVDQLGSLTSWDKVNLTLLSPRDLSVLTSCLEQKNLRYYLYPHRVFVINGAQTYEEYFSGLNKKFRGHQKRSRRLAQERSFIFRNDLSFQHYKDLYDARKGKISDDYSTDPRFLDFFENFREQMIAQKKCHEVGLFDGSKVIAVAGGFWVDDVFIFYQTAYDLAYEELRPGALIFDELFKQVLTKGCRYISLMGDLAYLRLYTKDCLEFNRLVVYNRTFKGRLLNFFHKLKYLRSRMRLLVRPGHSEVP